MAPREFSEPWKPEDIFDRQEAAARRARIDQAQTDHAALLKHDANQAVLRKIKADDTSRRANESFLKFEYSNAGLVPPWTDGNGIPTVSLSTLKWMGWKIENYSGQATLVAPLAGREHVRRRKEDYDGSS
jgi:hypothetical protein